MALSILRQCKLASWGTRLAERRPFPGRLVPPNMTCAWHFGASVRLHRPRKPYARHEAGQRLSSTTSTIFTPQHGSFRIDYFSSSVHCNSRPGCNKWRVSTAEVRSVFLLCLLACELLSMDNSRRTVSIHVLDDDSLLHVFHLCRPFVRNEDGPADWGYSGRWWYALAHVCRRWRNIVLGSANYLGLFLLCTYGTPVVDMLAHSPPLPLVVGYFRNDRELTTEDEEGIILAFKHRDRVRRVRLYSTGTILQKLIVAMDDEYPILEYLYITLPLDDNNMILRFPGTLQAPHLRHLELQGFALPIGSPLLTTAVGLVTLDLAMIHPSTYFHPNTLLQWISFMPYLEMLKIRFEFSIPNRDVERQLRHTPIITPIALPNLHVLYFRGVSAYLEAVVHRITTPRLEKLEINFFNQLTFSVPRLLQFIIAAENFRLSSAALYFSNKSAGVGVYPHAVYPLEETANFKTRLYTLAILVNCCHLDWQASSMAQISSSLSQIFSEVEHLYLQRNVHSESSGDHNDVDHAEWRKLLRPFSNVKTLRIHRGLVKDLSRCLELEDGGLPLELLPKLQRIAFLGRGNTGGALTSFIDTRRNAGRPVTLVRF